MIDAVSPYLPSLIARFCSQDDDVEELTTENFAEEVLESEDLWMVEFYAPW